MQPACNLGIEMGYKMDRDLHLMRNGEKIIIE
jgi:hypothetical protein